MSKLADLRHAITIRRYTNVADGSGGFTRTHVDTSTRASIQPVSGRETFESMKLEAKVSHKITVRFGVSVKPTDDIVFGSRLFKVSAVINIDERSRWMLILAEEIV